MAATADNLVAIRLLGGRLPGGDDDGDALTPSGRGNREHRLFRPARAISCDRRFGLDLELVSGDRWRPSPRRSVNGTPSHKAVLCACCLFLPVLCVARAAAV